MESCESSSEREANNAPAVYYAPYGLDVDWEQDILLQNEARRRRQKSKSKCRQFALLPSIVAFLGMLVFLHNSIFAVNYWQPEVVNVTPSVANTNNVVAVNRTSLFSVINVEKRLLNQPGPVSVEDKISPKWYINYEEIRPRGGNPTKEIMVFKEIVEKCFEKKIRSYMRQHQRLSYQDETFIQWEHLGDLIHKIVTDVIRKEYVACHTCELLQDNVTYKTQPLDVFINKLIKGALMIYDADKTGRADYALASAGGEIVNTRRTKSFPTFSVSIFGFYVWRSYSNPRVVIQPGINPGECWSFSGVGHLVIKLSRQISVTGFSVEHIPPFLALDGNIDSAPKDFSVYGIRSECTSEDLVFLGRFTYLITSEDSLQYFRSLTHMEYFTSIELRVESNHGNKNYTCLYRFRVHGIPAAWFYLDRML